MVRISDPTPEVSPFGYAAPIYRAKGWLGTLLFRERTKWPPPVGFTGGKGHYPDEAQINRWLADESRCRGNIGLWTGPIEIDGQLLELFGLDTDHYISGDQEKRGGDSLAELEKKLGTLPEAPISSARCDGISGIRWFLVPAGLRWFESQAGPGIEIVYFGCHYGIVWPSIHPDMGVDPAVGIYLWYLAGCKPDGNGLGAEGIPYAARLPFLPAVWVDYLTNGRMLRAAVVSIDMNSTNGELYKWAEKTFNDGSAEAMCFAVRESKDKWIERIKSDSTSHDKVRDGGWEILWLAAEGCTGWLSACNELEKFWADNVKERDKRRLGEMVREIVSSRNGALRKIKAAVDQAAEIGALYTPPQCLCSPAYRYPEAEIFEQIDRRLTAAVTRINERIEAERSAIFGPRGPKRPKGPRKPRLGKRVYQ